MSKFHAQDKIFQLSFVNREKIDNGDDTPIAICTVQLLKEAPVTGRGNNKKKAKVDACRKAMKAHEIDKQTSEIEQ